MRANVNLGDLSSLQRGASHYINYCLGCHSLNYLRYNRIAEDLEIPIEVVEQNLIFATDADFELVRSGEPLSIPMSMDFAREAFGNTPPDLSLIGRSRGADWIFTYLNSFYLDESRPYGVNNLLFPDVGMPHVLWQQQGWPTLESPTEEGAKPKLNLDELGDLSPQEFSQFVRDITAFLIYASEPIQIRRTGYGSWLMLFMAVLTLLLWLLKREYWSDIKES